ncbi:extracellular superoxide dismutase [Cu-Zn] [Protopterus annectens]|uniref:extracellular superoxide dismutase [Cu-Zn] n=1 Tax=Protopterus annectens TaxID=7888 RepID=UPI001CF9D471|nr:extracellular superoxide dismutase [Cu-Zn] [Protopterus annectens]
MRNKMVVLSLSVTMLLSLFISYSTGTDEVPLKDNCTLANIEEKINDMWFHLFHHHPIRNGSKDVYAICVLKPSTKLEPGKPVITGHVLFKQRDHKKKTEAIFNVEGFLAGDVHQKRAIHVHEFGDISDGCDSTGGHYNPYGVKHPYHPGDFGNFLPKDGKITKKKSIKVTLIGPDSILGRAIVVHENEDDLGKGGNEASHLHGNAGKRLACCVIGLSTKNKWYQSQNDYK